MSENLSNCRIALYFETMMRSADHILALRNNTKISLPKVLIFLNPNNFQSKPIKSVFLTKLSFDLLLLTSITITRELKFLINGHFFYTPGAAVKALL